MNLPETCPFCGADTTAGDWKRWPVSPGVNLERELALARARIARLEDAGDMLEWRIACGCGQGGPCRHCADTLEAWSKAKEAKP